MGYGWAGRIISIDLTRKKVVKDPLPKELAVKYLGSRGINARFLWEKTSPGIDPLGPDNLLMFGAGPLSGTFAPCSGRVTVTCKSPATSLYLKTSMGGHWGPELKLAGYDNIIIYGASKKPVYVWIDDERVEICDASHLWGEDVRETDKAIKEELGDQDIKVACIGPAGENLVRFAPILSTVYNAAGRGGSGAVMGSKKLKAIAVRGTGAVTVADPESFERVALVIKDSLEKDPQAKALFLYGTAKLVDPFVSMGIFPVRNFQNCSIKDADHLSGQYMVEAGYLVRRFGCESCVINCHRFTAIRKGSYQGAYSAGPEYEAIANLGARCGHTNMEAVIKANELCNIFGLDVISTGAVISWAMECYQRGIITEKDTDGLRLEWGDEDVIIKLIRKIALREGFGNILADGTKRASEKIGKGSEKFTMQAKGLEQAATDVRGAKGYALAFTINPRGPDHLYASPSPEWGATPYHVKLFKNLTGLEPDPHSVKGKPELVRWVCDWTAVLDSLGLCYFPFIATSGCLLTNELATIFSAATGVKMTETDLVTAGSRIVNLERCFNVREGCTRKDDVLPQRMMEEPIPDGPSKGMRNSPGELEKMLDEYYSLRGWDKETGKPKRNTLEKLGLKDVADELEKT